jgi:hypothetical protein
MNTNPEMDEHKTRTAQQALNEFRPHGPRTIPTLWDVSEMLTAPTPSMNGSKARGNGSTAPVEGQEQAPAPAEQPGKVISELPESDYPAFFFKPY